MVKQTTYLSQATRARTSAFRRAWSRLTLSSRISAVTSLLFLVTILAIGTLALNAFRSELKEVLVAQQNTLLERLADDLDQRLLMLQRALTVSAQTVTSDNVTSGDAAQRFLDGNAGLHAVFDRSVFLFSPEGRLIAEYPYLPSRRGQDFSFRGYIRDTVRTGRPVISEPFITTKDDQNAVLMLTAPVFSSDGKLMAILAGSLGLTRPTMLGNIAKTVIGKTGHLYLVTADGRLIMHPDKVRLSQPLFAPGANSLFDEALRGYEGTDETVEPTGKRVLTSYKKISSAGWILVARYPDDEAFSPFTKMAWRFVNLLAAACILVLAAVWWITRGLLRPLASLTREIKRNSIADGKVSAIDVGAKAEIGDLERAFNDLVGRLHDREDTLVHTMQSYQLITDNSTDLITKHTGDGVITYASPACKALLGVSTEDVLRHSALEFVHPRDREAVRTTFREAARDRAPKAITYRMRRADHQYVWFETTLRRMSGQRGDTGEVLCISRDISERKRMEEYLHDLARRDVLTELPNRTLLEESIGKALVEAHRNNQTVAILVIDLDRFKNINDTLGHNAGDKLLKLAASRLKACIRPSDIVARWGGDEFVILLPGLRSVDIAAGVAERCLEALSQPFDVDGRSLHITTSIGISMFPDGGTGAEVLIKNADTAMYRAKAQGGDCYSIYAAEMNARAQERLSMESDLYFALDRNQLLLHYQPLISAKTGKLVGAEALLRWKHPELGLVAPGRFIPIAEDTGLIGKIGEWVLQQACSQMAEWRARGLLPIRLSVNLSSRQFRKDTLVNTISAVLRETRFDPQLLELEITETLLMENVKRSSAVIEELKSIGVRLSIDDFGTGYSSLSYLKRFPLNSVKIDRSFVSDVTTSESDASIVRATVALAKSLELKIIAEGVETKEQMDFLTQHGCDELQGFLFNKPMPPREFLSFALASPTFLLSKKVSA